jgi:hypothetical protein
MARSREKNREKVKATKEEMLNAKNEFGISDPTPKKAIANMINARLTHECVELACKKEES